MADQDALTPTRTLMEETAELFNEVDKEKTTWKTTGITFGPPPGHRGFGEAKGGHRGSGRGGGGGGGRGSGRGGGGGDKEGKAVVEEGSGSKTTEQAEQVICI